MPCPWLGAVVVVVMAVVVGATAAGGAATLRVMGSTGGPVQ